MPPEYYLGAAVAIVILGLVVSFIRSGTSRRRVPDPSIDTAQLVRQLSRIADSLETLVVRLGASSRSNASSPSLEQRLVEQPPVAQPMAAQPAAQPAVPLPGTPEPATAAPAKPGEPSERRVKLSMFGR